MRLPYIPGIGIPGVPFAGFGVSPLQTLVNKATSYIGSQVDALVFESEWTPPIVIGRPLAPNEDASTVPGPTAGSAAGGATPTKLPPIFEAALKPKITVYFQGEPISYAPQGDPGPSKWPIALLAGLGLLAGVFYLGRRSAQKRWF